MSIAIRQRQLIERGCAMMVALYARSAKDIAPVERNKAMIAALFLVTAAILVAPLLVIDIPLLADFPNHVARMHVIGNVEADLFLRERYGTTFDPIPNIAMDLLVPALAKWVSLDAAARIFLALCLLSTVAGVTILHHTLFNQWSLYPLIAALFAYHGSMIAGMANFSLGIGLVPAALAAWIKTQDLNAAWRILIGSAVMLLLFFCHLVAAGAFGLLLLSYGIARAFDQQGWRERRRNAITEFTIAGAIGFLPLMLFLRLALWSEGGSSSAGIVYGNVAWKLKALLSPLAHYNLVLDLTSFALIMCLALLLWWTGRLRFGRYMLPGLALLALAFLLAPKALWTGGVFDQRLVVLLALMLVACSRIEGPLPPGFRPVPLLLGVLFVIRMVVLTSTWLDHRADLAEMRGAIDLMTPGARLLVVRPDKEAGQRLAPERHRVFHHAVQLQSLPALAIIEKSAFVSTIYALQGQQPLILRPPFDRLGGRGHVDLPTLDALADALDSGRGDPSKDLQIRDWTSDFDHVLLIYGYGSGLDPRIAELPLEPLLDGEIIDFFRVINK